ncbi:DUF6745 domain-containing protein [Nocardia sp. XZ_19_385]|uniref:DUF6745 domain-containing protein n=1 Tax=Nocardia sp. XZ_19_385 TaxID=2769488 RepID=UPI001890A903|nr:hypothetical protein [Nocardia sp. XZ_19_385]
MRLDSLTAAQQELLASVRDEWIEVGLSTAPADREAAEQGALQAYRTAGVAAPKVIVWLESPLAGAIGQDQAIRLAGVRDRIWDQAGPRAWARIRAVTQRQARQQVWTQVEDRVHTLIDARVTAQVQGLVRAAVAGGIDEPVWQQVDSVVGEKMPAGSVVPWWEGNLGPQLGDSLAFYDAIQRLGVNLGGLLDGVEQVVRNAGWWWPMDGGLILTERPTVISRDDAGRLHNATAPAVAYRDGFTMWAWHGTRVPEYAITTDWDVDAILWEHNAEIRRCAIERMGWHAFIEESGMSPVGPEVPDPGNPPHTLRLYDLPDELRNTFTEPVRILLCTNGSADRDGTRRRFGLVVPAHYDDPVSAAASLYDIPVEAYRQLEIRR